MTEIPIELTDGIMPVKGSGYAAAYDVCVPRDFEIRQQRNIIPLGFKIQLPLGWKANIRPRSGYSAFGMEAEVRTTYKRYGGEEYVSTEKIRIDADVLLGLIDADYRDEVGVIIKACIADVTARQKYEFDTVMENHVFITSGTRIAQMEICGGDNMLVLVESIDKKIDRGGGFGHTG